VIVSCFLVAGAGFEPTTFGLAGMLAIKMKKTCLNCHFLSKEHHEEKSGRVLTFSLDQQKRDSHKKDPIGFDRGWYSLKCYMGVWDEGVSPVAKEEDDTLFAQDRGDSCFFIPYRKSMLFPAAVELQKREQENRNLKKSYKLTIIALWFAAIGLILNAIISFKK